jgi:SAM-dependent methyltransferase
LRNNDYQKLERKKRMVNETSPPLLCLLCKGRGGITPCGFQQVYPQKDMAPVLLDWWECRTCKGWFVYPVPSPEVIERHWGTVVYNDPKREIEIALAKEKIQKRILAGLAHWTKPGPLLDVGCNFGRFLLMAREAGWTPSGFEPNVVAAEVARAKGFNVYCEWLLEKVDFPESHFAAVTVNDAFCLVWNPIATLEAIHRLLTPGGTLAMRLTNKRTILGFVRMFSPVGQVRNIRISKLLQAQFHSVGLAQFSRIVRNVGFDRIQIQSHAASAPWSTLGWKTRLAYLGADSLYLLSLAKINLSPGVLFFAHKTVA